MSLAEGWGAGEDGGQGGGSELSLGDMFSIKF